jgi:hypothetical protein
MKPTCLTCNRRMSLATGSMFVCADAGNLSGFSTSGLSIIHYRGKTRTWSDLPTIKPKRGFHARAHKSKPPPVEPTGVRTRWMTSGEP